MYPETTALQNEIHRLNVIISVLVEKNLQLEQEIALLTGKAPAEKFKTILSENLKSSFEAGNILSDKSGIPLTPANILPENLHRMDAAGDRMEKNSNRVIFNETNLPENLDRMDIDGDRMEAKSGGTDAGGDIAKTNLDGMVAKI